MIRRPPRSTRTDTLFPYTTLFRSLPGLSGDIPRPAEPEVLVEAAQRSRLARHVRHDRAGSLPTQRRVSDHRALELSGQSDLWTVGIRSEEHTSELQSLMRISYAVFCLKKKNKQHNITRTTIETPFNY